MNEEKPGVRRAGHDGMNADKAEKVIVADMLSSTENYRSAVNKWCIKADFEDYRRWDDEC